MAQQTKSYLKGKFAQVGAQPTDTDMADLIDSIAQPGDAITADQVPNEVVGQVADTVINDPTFQANFAVNKVDDISNPNSTDVVTSKGVSDAVAIRLSNDSSIFISKS